MKSTTLFILLLLFLIVGIIFGITSCSSASSNIEIRETRMKESKQYEDGKFRNKIKNPEFPFSKTVKIGWKYMFDERINTVPTKPIPLMPLTGEDFNVKNQDTLQFARLGHSTVLLQIGGKIWLTDPIFSERASPFQWMGPKRFHPVPISMEDLPEIEGVLISHDHYDHLDYGTILQLKDKVKHFLVPLGVAEILESWGVLPEKIIAFDWWENTILGKIEFISTPASHFSGRGIFDKYSTLWTSWVIRSKNHSVYFSGDTGYFDGFKEIGQKYGPFDITFLENGAYNKMWKELHMIPEETMQAFKDLKGKLMVPIHNGTFDLSMHSWYEPMERITALAEQEEALLTIPYMGELVNILGLPQSVEWWKVMRQETGKAQRITLIDLP